MNLSRASTKRNQGLLQRGVPKARTRGSFRISHVGVSRFEQFVRSDIFHYLATGPQFVHAACNGSPADDLKFQHSVSQEPTKLLGLPGPNSMCFILESWRYSRGQYAIAMDAAQLLRRLHLGLALVHFLVATCCQ